ncbi:hypothetical protein KB206_00300 [Microvirga sp. STS02]|uniref:hypothetical protein n=1 Tax=Hymenobacter negativus TaxID=2795026 RepID=UPI0018DCDC92|nr:MULTISPECIES: hypothetical protein [Bacteria]MBH8567305.1 hypothetical protein [Hymenobacter negativus]MBR7207037.1 hypothetical protein [Microvirga sp. STS02]
MPTIKISPTMSLCDALHWAGCTLESITEANRLALAGLDSGPADDVQVVERATLTGQSWAASLGVGYLANQLDGLYSLLGQNGRNLRLEVLGVLDSGSFTLSPTVAATLARLPELTTGRDQAEAKTVLARIATLPASLAQVRAVVESDTDLKTARQLL